MKHDPAVDWYFDLVSPFAYLALAGVERLAARRPVRLRPVVFGAMLQQWGGLGPAEVPPKRRHTYRLCQFLADRAGVPFCFPPTHPFRSLDALRGLSTRDEPDPAAVRAAFEHIWARGDDPALLPGSTDPAGKERLRAWTAEAVAAGCVRRAQPGDRRRGVLGPGRDADGGSVPAGPGAVPNGGDGAVGCLARRRPALDLTASVPTLVPPGPRLGGRRRLRPASYLRATGQRPQLAGQGRG